MAQEAGGRNKQQGGGWTLAHRAHVTRNLDGLEDRWVANQWRTLPSQSHIDPEFEAPVLTFLTDS